jgi:transcriptional regulator with XRE-family HTH domain
MLESKTTEVLYMATSGERIKELRKALGLSADDLGERIGKDRATIFRYEKGEIENMPLAVIYNLADALHVSPGYLMGWVKDADAPSRRFRAAIENELNNTNQADVDAAVETELDIAFLNHIIESEGPVSLDDACKAADELGMTIGELLDEKDLRVFSTMSPQVKQIMEDLLGLPADKQEKALDYIRYLSTSQGSK